MKNKAINYIVNNKEIFPFILLLFFMLMGTGFVSDDFVLLNKYEFENFSQMMIPSGEIVIKKPLEYYFHVLPLSFISYEDQYLFDLLKFIYASVSFLMVRMFFRCFANSLPATFAAFIFITMPLHDATLYWFLAQYLMLSFAFYSMSFYYAFQNRMTLTYVYSFIGSFISYGSTPIALGFSLYFLINKKYKQSAAIILPNIVYIAYYIYIVVITGNEDGVRDIKTLDIQAFVNSMFIQIGSALDVFPGPSGLLKIYYSLLENNLQTLSILAIFFASMFFLKKDYSENVKIDRTVVLSIVVLVIAALVMFSTTGFFPQLAFNLGNRVSIYYSFLIVIMILLLHNRYKNTHIFIIVIMVASSVGLSNHWKEFNENQRTLIQVLSDQKHNLNLKSYIPKGQKNIFVTGDQYSILGGVGHIEHLSTSHLSALFSVAGDAFLDYKLIPINSRYRFSERALVDTKFNITYRQEKYVIYDVNENRVYVKDEKSMKKFIASFEKIPRHWLQLLPVDNFISSIILALSPRLKYAF